MAIQHDITVDADRDYYLSVILQTGLTNPANLTGYIVTMAVKKSLTRVMERTYACEDTALARLKVGSPLRAHHQSGTPRELITRHLLAGGRQNTSELLRIE